MSSQQGLVMVKRAAFRSVVAIPIGPAARHDLVAVDSRRTTEGGRLLVDR